jgi:signal peptidase I
MLKQIRSKLKWLDPFTYVDLYLMPKVNPKKSETLSWAVYMVCAFFFAWLIYTGLGLALGTATPMMIVVSSSMEPVLYRGDIVVLLGSGPEGISGQEEILEVPSLKETELSSFASPSYNEMQAIESIKLNTGSEIQVTKEGDIVVYWSDFRQEPIIHRVVAKLKAGDGTYFLTKGDSKNNTTIDQDCGRVINGMPEKSCIELYPVPAEKLQGKVLFQVPLLGCIKLWVVDDLGSLLATGSLPKEWEPHNLC